VSTADETLGELQPRQLIVTVYGLYARDAQGWLPVAGLVRLLGELDVGPQAVRSSISRLKRRDTLRSLRLDGCVGYALSPSQRDKRHELRALLGRLGFGPVAPGVWTAPGRLADEVAGALERQGLGRYVDLFRGEHLGYVPLAERVREWWDLPGTETRYAEFLAAHRSLARRVARRPTTGGEAFAAYARMLTAWRRLRYRDPGLPLELLPAGWKGVAAAELFQRLHTTLGPPAEAHAREVIQAAT
jgi:phenylacetic acid degradation operon negative regulatory protein